MNIMLNVIKQLHKQTSAGYIDAKTALEKANGDFEKAIIVLREKGIFIAEKKVFKPTKEGIVGFYIHHNKRIGVMIEVNCETEFAASTKVFKNLAYNLVMHIAAMNPLCISRTDILPVTVAEERSIFEAQARNEHKSEFTITCIVEDKLKKYYENICLLDQPYFKNSDKSVNDVLTEYIAILKENITIKRFIRYEVGR